MRFGPGRAGSVGIGLVWLQFKGPLPQGPHENHPFNLMGAVGAGSAPGRSDYGFHTGRFATLYP